MASREIIKPYAKFTGHRPAQMNADKGSLKNFVIIPILHLSARG
jgi:hypothetical protein